MTTDRQECPTCGSPNTLKGKGAGYKCRDPFHQHQEQEERCTLCGNRWDARRPMYGPSPDDLLPCPDPCHPGNQVLPPSPERDERANVATFFAAVRELCDEAEALEGQVEQEFGVSTDPGYGEGCKEAQRVEALLPQVRVAYEALTQELDELRRERDSLVERLRFDQVNHTPDITAALQTRIERLEEAEKVNAAMMFEVEAVLDDLAITLRDDNTADWLRRELRAREARAEKAERERDQERHAKENAHTDFLREKVRAEKAERERDAIRADAERRVDDHYAEHERRTKAVTEVVAERDRLKSQPAEVRRKRDQLIEDWRENSELYESQLAEERARQPSPDERAAIKRAADPADHPTERLTLKDVQTLNGYLARTESNDA